MIMSDVFLYGDVAQLTKRLNVKTLQSSSPEVVQNGPNSNMRCIETQAEVRPEFVTLPPVSQRIG